jgi:hypothetical protein
VADPWPYLRLWQAVTLLAIEEASHKNSRQIEARLFVEDGIFDGLCNLFGWDATRIRIDLELDAQGVYERLKKAKRAGGWK